MDQIFDAFSDESFIQKVQEKLPYIFRIAEIECSRDGKIGMEVRARVLLRTDFGKGYGYAHTLEIV